MHGVHQNLVKSSFRKSPHRVDQLIGRFVQKDETLRLARRGVHPRGYICPIAGIPRFGIDIFSFDTDAKHLRFCEASSFPLSNAFFTKIPLPFSAKSQEGTRSFCTNDSERVATGHKIRSTDDHLVSPHWRCRWGPSVLL